MMKYTYLLLFSLLLCPLTYANGADMEKLRHRVKQHTLRENIDLQKVQHLLDSFRGDSIWPGINYVDTSIVAFEHAVHLSNIEYLAQAYNLKGTRFFKNKQVKKTLGGALDFWLRHDFKCANWWWNEIGVPNGMIRILYLMDRELTEVQLRNMIEIAGRENVTAPGARPSGDRIQMAGEQAKTELFKRNAGEFKSVLRVIEGEMKFATGFRGLQADYSFHHREDRVNNTLGYGSGFLNTFAEWSELLSDTQYRFAESSVQMAIDYFLNGICKQMVYGRTIDPGVMNREISRQGEGTGFVSPRPAQQLMSASNYRKQELEAIVNARIGKLFTPASFARFYWQTEHFVFQRPGFYTSVRMHSVRNATMEESHNHEALQNHYRGDGTNYLSRRGDEYVGMPPVNDWMKISGTTEVLTSSMPARERVQQWGYSEFVGGVDDGLYGAAVFDFKSVHHPLSAKKAWFFFDREYVCLGAGISARNSEEVVTTLNQCALKTGVTVSREGKAEVLNKGEHRLSGVSWVWQDSVGYLFPQPAAVQLTNTVRTGKWTDITLQSNASKEPVEKEVFLLWQTQGRRPKNNFYAYIVMPSVSQTQLEEASRRPQVAIVENSPALQAVYHAQLCRAYGVFHRSGSLSLPNGLVISTETPCLLMVKCAADGTPETISVSDPSRKLTALYLSFNKQFAVKEPQNTVTQTGSSDTQLRIGLPQGDDCGASVTVALQPRNR